MFLSRFVKVGATGTVISWAIFLVGFFSYGSLHMPWVLRIIEVIYVAMIAIVDDENQSSADGDTMGDTTATDGTTPRLSAEVTDQITTAIAQWRQAKGYGAQNLTIIPTAERLGIPKRQLTQYLTEHERLTFRVWLSNIRIEEAKRMLSERDYSIESIAESCGFSSVSWMREKFKASTGMTPAEWREAEREK